MGACSFAVHASIEDQLKGFPLTEDEINLMKENTAKLSKEEELKIINLKGDELRKYGKLIISNISIFDDISMISIYFKFDIHLISFI
jgi:hypothetical protein